MAELTPITNELLSNDRELIWATKRSGSGSVEQPKVGHRRTRWGLRGALVAIAGIGIGWAAATIFTPVDDVLDSGDYTYAEVAPGEVGWSIKLNTVALWTPVPVGSNLASGVVTSTKVTAGQQVEIGTVLYTVNLRPVVIAQGAVPAFRTLSSGDTGADVAQLQSLLATLHLYVYEVDGNYDGVTERSVRAWQETLGLEPDGIVQASDIIYVPTLPTRIALDVAKVDRGLFLSGGETIVHGLPPVPSFAIPVTESQARVMPVGTRVEIAGPSGEEWEAFVVNRVIDEEGAINLVLEGRDGTAICGDACGAIPVSGQALLASRVVTVESVAGLVVPTAALLSRVDSTLAVIDEEGLEHAVTLVTSARGMSVIEGIPAGMMVRIPVTGQ